MKISNQDIIRLAEIKSYFLDPPYTFRINSYAMPQVDEAINIVKKYTFISPALAEPDGRHQAIVGGIGK